MANCIKEHTVSECEYVEKFDITEHADELDTRKAGHLLRRCLTGPRFAEIVAAKQAGLATTLNNLLQETTPPEPPLNHFYQHDPNVPVGRTWVQSPIINGVNFHQYRSPSLRAWYLQNLLDGPTSLTDRMLMFWVNHFAVSDTSDERAFYDYLTLLRKHALGNFRTLVKEVTINPAMLEFLHGRFSYVDSPNENYPRELLELYTVGIGAPNEPRYTEKDIVAMSRVLTGWRVKNYWSTVEGPIEAYFQADWHDTGDKQLSAHFNHAVIRNEGAREYETLIDIIFEHPETSRSICRNLYIFFASGDITAAVERDIIAPLARILVDNNYEIRPVMRALLSSEHFFSRQVQGAIIKSPYEFIVSMVRSAGGYGYLNLDLRTLYDLLFSFQLKAEQLGMDFMVPPTVSGWVAYYRSPSFHRNWINGTTLKLRRQLAEETCVKGIWSRDKQRPLNWLGLLASLSNPNDINAVIDDIVTVFLPRAISDSQTAVLKEILNENLPDFEWSVEYSLFQQNGPKSNEARILDTKFKRLFRHLCDMPEFHLQ